MTVEAVPQDQLDAVAAREAELDEREAALDEREAAVTNAEEEAAANEITDGVWTVGVDVSAGPYAAQDVSADCYWAITRTGSKGADIINNGIPGGGNPQVTLEEGQDFATSSCGTWQRQQVPFPFKINLDIRPDQRL